MVVACGEKGRDDFLRHTCRLTSELIQMDLGENRTLGTPQDCLEGSKGLENQEGIGECSDMSLRTLGPAGGVGSVVLGQVQTRG